MNIKRATLVRLVLLIIGTIGAITGFAFVLSNGTMDPIPGLRYANNLSGIVIGTLGLLIVVIEVGQLYYGYEKNLKSQIK